MASIKFLIIGAQKSGTTSLFEYLRRHPQIHMPQQKEMAFFSTERNYRRGTERYVKAILLGAQPGAACGEASVAYMDGTPFGDLSKGEYADLSSAPLHNGTLEEIVPNRIKELLPDVRLICVLRDPVQRSYSHYRMAVLDKAESRTFDDAVAQLLEPSALMTARVTPMINNSYIVNGEYFRVLNGFLRVFAREQLKVIFSDELAERPAEVISDAYRFIGVSDDFVPDNLSTRYRTGATERRIDGLDLYALQGRLTHAASVRAMWRALPGSIRDKIDRAFGVAGFRVELWNARRERDSGDEGMAPNARSQLVAHFRQDSEALEKALGTRIPWLTTWTRS
jgi:hypothetical protein